MRLLENEYFSVRFYLLYLVPCLVCTGGLSPCALQGDAWQRLGRDVYATTSELVDKCPVVVPTGVGYRMLCLFHFLDIEDNALELLGEFGWTDEEGVVQPAVLAVSRTRNSSLFILSFFVYVWCCKDTKKKWIQIYLSTLFTTLL